MLLRVLVRAGVFVASLAVSSVLVFWFLAGLPGDPARRVLGVNATEEAVAALRREFGLDRPLVTQYLDWIGGMITGDPGRSYVSKAEIAPQLADRLQVTLWLVGVGDGDRRADRAAGRDADRGPARPPLGAPAGRHLAGGAWRCRRSWPGS